MADDLSRVAFDPTPMGAPQTFSGPTGADNPDWQRMLAAARAGAISPAQLSQYAARMGYAPPQQPVGQQQPAQGQQQQQMTGPAGLGQVTGDLVGRAARALIEAGRKVTPQAPGADQNYTQQYDKPMTSSTPSPLWNQ